MNRDIHVDFNGNYREKKAVLDTFEMVLKYTEMRTTFNFRGFNLKEGSKKMSDEKKFVVAQLSSIQGQYFNYDKEEDAVEKASILANSSEKPTIGIYRLMKLAKPETPPVIIVDVK